LCKKASPRTPFKKLHILLALPLPLLAEAAKRAAHRSFSVRGQCFRLIVLHSDEGLTSGCHCWLVQQCDPIQKELLRNTTAFFSASVGCGSLRSPHPTLADGPFFNTRSGYACTGGPLGMRVIPAQAGIQKELGPGFRRDDRNALLGKSLRVMLSQSRLV